MSYEDDVANGKQWLLETFDRVADEWGVSVHKRALGLTSDAAGGRYSLIAESSSGRHESQDTFLERDLADLNRPHAGASIRATLEAKVANFIQSFEKPTPGGKRIGF